jgi:hypothetical protein
VTVAEATRAGSPAEMVLASFEGYLLVERALATGTVRGYVCEPRTPVSGRIALWRRACRRDGRGRISSRSARDRRTGEGSHAVGSAGGRAMTLVTACLEHSTRRPTSRRECPRATSLRVSGSKSSLNLLTSTASSGAHHCYGLAEKLRGSLEHGQLRRSDPAGGRHQRDLCGAVRGVTRPAPIVA